MNPEQRKRLKSLLAKQASGEKLTPDEEQALTSARANFADEFASVTKQVSEESKEKSPGQSAQEQEKSPEQSEQNQEESKSSTVNPNATAGAGRGYQIGSKDAPFEMRTPEEVDTRNAQGREFLGRGARARMNAARVTGQQANDLRSSREAELLDQGVSPAKSKIVAQMEAQNMLRVSRGLPTFTTTDIVGDEKQGYSLSSSSRDQRLFNESRGLTEYGAEVRAPLKNAGETELLGRSIIQPDGNIAFSTTEAGRKLMGTEGRDRFAGIGRNPEVPGLEGESTLSRAILEANSTNGVVDTQGVVNTQGSGVFAGAGKSALQAQQMLGNQRRGEFSAAMNQRATNPNADVGVDPTGKPRTAKDMLKRSQKLGGVLQRRAGVSGTYKSENLFGR